MSYAVITPARNEAENLRRVAECLIAQTIPPLAWVIVDDGSTDDTPAVAAALAAQCRWIHVRDSRGATERAGPLRAGRRAGRDIVAFHAGLESLAGVPAEFYVKLDADVSFEPDYFERVLEEFGCDPTLAIAGGTCWEQDRAGVWRAVHVRRTHVRGAARVWRARCLDELLPLEEALGWDTIDETKAVLLGWRVQSFDVPFRHHRQVGARDGLRREWEAQGALAHYLGYRFWYLVGRALRHVRRDPTAVALVLSYVASVVRRQPKYRDAAVRAAIRKQQSLRTLPFRAREALSRAR